MKKSRKSLIEAIVFILIFLGGLYILYGVFSWKDTSGGYSSIETQLDYIEKELVDVSFVGPSRAYSSVNPAVLWERGGISSVDMSVSGMDRTASTFYIKELLKKQSPKVIFIEASTAFTDDYQVESNLYRNTISMDLSVNNVKMINELVDRKDVLTYVLRWPILHSRYKELKRLDYVDSARSRMALGFSSEYYAQPQVQDMSVFNITEAKEVDNGIREWIKELKTLASKEGFEVVFYMAPMLLDRDYKIKLNGLYEYLDEEGIRYIDFNLSRDLIDLDYETDLSDAGHSNYSGAVKVSGYLSEILNSEYSLPDHRGDSKYSLWDKCVSYDRNLFLDDTLGRETDTLMYLDKLSDMSGMTVVMAFNEGSGNLNGNIRNLLVADYGINCDEFVHGGSVVLVDGQVIFAGIAGSFTDFNHKLNESQYLTLRATASSETFVKTSVNIGEKNYLSETDNTNCIYVYDTVTDQLVDFRILE